MECTLILIELLDLSSVKIDYPVNILFGSCWIPGLNSPKLQTFLGNVSFFVNLSTESGQVFSNFPQLIILLNSFPTFQSGHICSIFSLIEYKGLGGSDGSKSRVSNLSTLL